MRAYSNQRLLQQYQLLERTPTSTRSPTAASPRIRTSTRSPRSASLPTPTSIRSPKSANPRTRSIINSLEVPRVAYTHNSFNDATFARQDNGHLASRPRGVDLADECHWQYHVLGTTATTEMIRPESAHLYRISHLPVRSFGPDTDNNTR